MILVCTQRLSGGQRQGRALGAQGRPFTTEPGGAGFGRLHSAGHVPLGAGLFEALGDGFQPGFTPVWRGPGHQGDPFQAVDGMTPIDQGSLPV